MTQAIMPKRFSPKSAIEFGEADHGTRFPSRIGDLHKASASVKARLPGNSPNAEKELKGYGAEAGAKIDQAVRSAHQAHPLCCFHISAPSLHSHLCIFTSLISFARRNCAGWAVPHSAGRRMKRAGQLANW